MADKFDSFYSAVTGLGKIGSDPRTSLRFVTRMLPQYTLDALYVEDGLSALIVDIYPEEALDKGVKIECPDNPDVEKWLQARCDAMLPKLRQTLINARKDGGAALLLGVDDGQDASEAVKRDSIQRVRWVAPLNEMEISGGTRGVDPAQPDFRLPTHYTIGGVRTADAQVYIHPSRVIPFYGIEVPWQVADTLGVKGWGVSVLQRAYTPLLNYVSTNENVASLIQNYHQAIFQIKDLASILAQGEEGEKVIQQRIKAAQYGRSNINALILDTEETFTTTTTDLRGLTDIVIQYATHLAAVTRIPLTKLFGRSPDGMNATGDSDARNWAKSITTYQTKVVEPGLRRVLDLYLASADSPSKDVSYTISFPAPQALTESEEATIRYTQAQADQVYLSLGVVEPNEIRESRFAGEYDTTTTLAAGVMPQAEAVALPDPSDVLPDDPSDQAAEKKPAASAGGGDIRVVITSLIEVATKVQSGELAAEAGEEIAVIALPNVPREQIRKLIQAAKAAQGTKVADPVEE